MGDANNSISPISPPHSMNRAVDRALDVNNDNKEKQVSFLNTLLKAAVYVENGEESKQENIASTNNSAMEISNAQQIPILGQMNASNMQSTQSQNGMNFNGLVLPNQVPM